MALTQSKPDSHWVSSRSIWGTATPHVNDSSSRVTGSLLNGVPPSKASEAQYRPYPAAPPFVTSPWGRKQSQSSSTALGSQIASDRRPSTFGDHRPGPLLDCIDECNGYPFASADERTFGFDGANRYSSDDPLKSYFASGNSHASSSSLNRASEFDLQSDPRHPDFTPWDLIPLARDERKIRSESEFDESVTTQWNTARPMTLRPDPVFGEFSPSFRGYELQAAPKPSYSPPTNQLSTKTLNLDSAPTLSRFVQNYDKNQRHDHNRLLPPTHRDDQHFSSTSQTYRSQPDKQRYEHRFEPFSETWTSGGSLEEQPCDYSNKFHPKKPGEMTLPPSRPRDQSYNNGFQNGFGMGYSDAKDNSSIINKPSGYQLGNRSTSTGATIDPASVSLNSKDREHYLRTQPLETAPNLPPARLGPSYAYGTILKSQTNGMSLYFQMPLAHQVVPPNMSHIPEQLPGHSFRSALLEDFKTNSKGARRFELRDIYDHVVEFSGDQNGSRFIQDKLITANSDEKSRVFNEILPNALQLMTDVFGNYVIQRFFERGDQNQKRILVGKMKGQMLALSNHVYGCRAVQSALHFVLVEQQVSLVKELEPDNNVLKCVKDQNGNHVIQAAIEHVPSEHIQFIMDAFLGQVFQLATHAYGCRVVQRLLKYWSEPGRSMILREVHACTSTLISDQYGNYVIQYMLENEAYDDRLKIINAVRQDLVGYAKQKFASNVVERCFSCGTEEQRRDMMLQLSARDERGESPLTYMIKDAYGNYVIQTLLDTLDDVNYATFVNILTPEIARAKRFVPNKQAENVAKKMHRLDKKFGCDHVYSNPMSRPLQSRFSSMPMPSPLQTRSSGIPLPISTAIPSPPLTAEGNRTPLSGSIPGSNDEQLGGVRLPNLNFNSRPFGYGISGS